MKLYLSKSKLSNCELVNKVRNYLSNYNLEIVEWKAGSYDASLVNSCDLFLAIPQELPKAYNSRVIVSRGVFNEIKSFYINDISYPYILTIDGDELYVSRYTFSEIVDIDDWKNNYGAVHFNAPIPLSTHLLTEGALVRTDSEVYQNISNSHNENVCDYNSFNEKTESSTSESKINKNLLLLVNL